MQLLTPPHDTWPVSQLVHATRSARTVELTWAGGDTRSLPLIWLRDNCPCAECRIVTTGEHRFFLGQTEQAPDASDLVVVDNTLQLTWNDGHRSTYSADDFARLTHIANRANPSAIAWGDDYAPRRFAHDDILNDAAFRIEFFHATMRDGMSVVTEMPTESGECIRFLDALKLPIRETPFDRLHDVFFRSDGYNVAHTAEALPPHNDFASYTWPPSGQLIHMLVNDVQGGDWVNVDGFRVLQQLWATDPQAVTTLAQVPVAFREHSDTAESWTRAPIVRLDGQGNITGIRFSNQLMQPLSPSDPNIEAFYDAYYLLARAINHPSNQIELRGHAGTMQVLHGHRILHSRRAFDAGTGARHLQDTYFDFDDLAALAALTSGEAR